MTEVVPISRHHLFSSSYDRSSDAEEELLKL